MIKNASQGHTLCTYRNGQIFKILSLEPSCVRTTPLVLLVCPSIICKVFHQCIAAPPVSHCVDVTLRLSLSLSPSHRLTQSRPPFLAPHFLSLYPIRSFFHSLTLSAPLTQKYINIPSEKYIYVHKYVYICVYTYLCKMDEYRYYAGLSYKWMSTGIMLACHKNG